MSASELRFEGYAWAQISFALAVLHYNDRHIRAIRRSAPATRNMAPQVSSVRRFDFVRGFSGEAVREYLEAASSQFTVGEYWDSLNYNGGVPDFNQVRIQVQVGNRLKALATASQFCLSTSQQARSQTAILWETCSSCLLS